MSKYWYKNAILYSLDIATYLDSNGDGVGDISGLKHALNYVAGLGATCLWVLPFFPTPNKDNGYDIQDYYSVSEKLGNLGGFVELVDTADELGLRILIDLVVNHTSDQHPWFQEAVKNKDSKYRNYYIWIDEKPKDAPTYAIFGEKQGGSNWKYHKEAGAYYYHTFYPHQPDLNLTNPEVRKEIQRIMHFWLKLGISGFRMDAVPHMLREKGNERFDGDPHQILRDFREFVEDQRRDAVLIAEVDTAPERYKDFFGNGNQMHMLFNFYLDNYIFLSLATQKATPVANALKAMPQLSKREQMAIFIRNHDELDLERLSKEEREEVFKAFAPEKDMQIYGRGIRRRLPPMLKNNRPQMELAYSLLFTMPGTPVLRYGQEIGMGDDLSLKERNSVRTPMQWSSQKNAGFSTAPESALVMPMITSGDYGYKHINVKDQHRDPNSILNWMRQAISFRKECPAFGWGKYEILETGNQAVLAHRCCWEDNLAIGVHNFSDQEVSLTLSLEEEDTDQLLDVFGDRKYHFDAKTGKLHLGPFGYLWLRQDKLQI